MEQESAQVNEKKEDEWTRRGGETKKGRGELSRQRGKGAATERGES